MAIDRVKRVTLLVPAYKSRPLISRLYQLGVLHVSDVFPSIPAAQATLRKYSTSAHNGGDKIQKLEFVVSALSLYLTQKKSFLDGLFPVPVQVKKKEFIETISAFQIDRVHNDCKALCDEQTSVKRELNDVCQEMELLKSLYGLPWTLSELKAIRKVVVRLGIFSKESWHKLTDNPQAKEILSWQDVTPIGVKWKRILVVCLPEDDGEAKSLLAFHGFQELTVPEFPGKAEERGSELEKREHILLDRQETLRAKMFQLADQYHWRAVALLGYLESEREKQAVETNFARSRKLLVITGYIRTKDVHILEDALKAEFPQHAAIYNDPSPEENVPVSLTLSTLFRPVQLITNMFGLPNYFTFDPTPYIVLNFLLFFGICFGDVIYGIMLMGLSYYMMRRYRLNYGLSNFFCLFLYAGISTVFCGALMGGWAGDLYKPEYLGQGNPLLRLKETLSVFDPLNDILVALVIALGLGIVNQFYALGLRMYREFRMGRPVDALLDGGMWLIFLSGLVILIGHVFIAVPPEMVRIGKAAAALGVVGLVLTQGRKTKGVAARLIMGLISVYGIVGTYGATTFISDILSYSRLLALGLTTGIIAMSFNIIAALVGSAGTIFFILALIIGHTLNFAICIIGSFVHPARLIMLEFFSRFYEAGAVRFRPFGFHSERIQIID
ncbi:MAG: V-type ATP synthase subunit I [Planctomycetota bacterium]